jgi:hypothetical protein
VQIGQQPPELSGELSALASGSHSKRARMTAQVKCSRNFPQQQKCTPGAIFAGSQPFWRGNLQFTQLVKHRGLATRNGNEAEPSAPVCQSIRKRHAMLSFEVTGDVTYSRAHNVPIGVPGDHFARNRKNISRRM